MNQNDYSRKDNNKLKLSNDKSHRVSNKLTNETNIEESIKHNSKAFAFFELNK